MYTKWIRNVHVYKRIELEVIATLVFVLFVYIVGCNPKLISVNFITGEYEFNRITTISINSRFPEHSMTNDPEMVWPGGIVHYMIDRSVGKF